MSIHTPSTSANTRHVGTVGDKRVAVVIQDPQATHEVHVVDTDALPDMYHQNLMDMLMTPQAQSSKWFGEYLHRNMLFDGTNALKTFYERKWIQVVPVTSVTLTPRPNVRIPLTEALGITIDSVSKQHNQNPLNDPLAAQQNPAGVQEQAFQDIIAQEQDKLNAFDPSQTTHNQHQANLDGDVSEQNRMVAANLLAEAKLLEADALRKREAAAQYDPSTKTQKGSYTPVSETVAYNPLSKDAVVDEGGDFVDSDTGKSYKTESALKAAVTRRENAAKKTGNG